MGSFSADDFNSICRRFPTIILDGVKVLTMDEHNEAKRFTNFLDCAYENHCRLLLFNMESEMPEDVFRSLMPLESITMKVLSVCDFIVFTFIVIDFSGMRVNWKIAMKIKAVSRVKHCVC